MALNNGWTYRWTDLPWLVGTATVYALLAKIVLTFYSAHGLATVFWPGSGVALAALLLGGSKFSIAIYVGAIAGHLWAGQSPGTALLISFGSVLEPLLGAWLLSRKGNFDVSLRSTRAFFRLCYLAAALSPGISTLIGVSALLLAGDVAEADLWHASAHWWMGDALGIVVVAPLIMVWRQPPRKPLLHVPETIALFGLSFLVGQIVFFDWFHDTFGLINRGYWMYLAVSWAAVRVGRHGVLLVVLLATLQALVGAALGLGLFGDDLAMTQLTNFWASTMIFAVVGISLAIVFSERERITVRLRSSEHRLRVAKTAAGLGIFDHGIASGRTRWDERMRELWGIGPDESITYAAFMAGVHPDDRAATQAIIDRAPAPRSNGPDYAECRVISRADGSVRHVAANWKVLFESGRAVRVIGTVKDISAQKHLEKEIQERRSEMELFIKQQVAAQTAAAIAHELNQPLVSVSAYSEAALRMLRGGTKNPEKLTRALEGAMEQAQRAGRTLHELLDFLHKGETMSEPVDLNDVVRDALAITEESGYGRFSPVIELEPDLPPVLANRLQLQKVLDNLLRNGVEAMRGAGVPTAAITITVRTTGGRDMAQITVQDSGPGLDAETAHRIFEPFFTTKPGGMGLGLAISRALIEAHGGQMWADSGIGAGATFHFTLPFAS